MIFTCRLFLLFLLLLVFWPTVGQGAQVFNFEGKDFIRYDRSMDDNVQDVRNDMLSLKNVYKFRFKTIHPSGIFLFSKGTRGDFISIVLLHCKLRVVIHRQVSRDSTPDELNVVTGNGLCDGNWHSVQLIRNGGRVCIYLDRRRKCHHIPGQFSTYLDVDLHTFVAGIYKPANFNPSDKYQDIYQVPNYIGCLQSAILNKTKILKAAMKKKKYIKVHGSLNKNCSGQGLEDVVGFTNKESFLKLEAPAKRALLLSFHFRTYYENGLLFYSQSALFVKLLLVSGKLELQPYIKGAQGIIHQYKFPLGKKLADGHWHFVSVHINIHGFTLSVDKEKIRWKKLKHLKRANLTPYKTIYFGYGLGFDSFIGCLKQLKVNKKLVNASFNSGVQIGRCPIRNLCFPNPCKHETKCTNKAKDFSCDCSGLYYSGRLCTDPLYRSSCQEYAKLGLSRDSMCSVLPNKNISSRAFKVLCTVTGSRRLAAVIDNDNESWQKVEERTLDAVGPYFKRDIHYSMNFPNIKAVISGSWRCYQFVAINWTHSVLNVSGNNKPYLAYWISSSKKNGNPIPIITNGYIRQKSKLPVIAVLFHPDAVGSYYHVGPLKCVGTKTHSQPLPPFVDKRRFLKNVCSPLVEPKTSEDNRAHSLGEDDTIVDTGFMSLKTETLLKSEGPTTTEIKEEPSAIGSTQDKVVVTEKSSEIPESNTGQEKNALLPVAQNGNRSSHTTLIKRWEFLAALTVGSTFLVLMMAFLLWLVLNKRKMKAERGRSPSEPGSLSSRLNNNTDSGRESVCDEIGLQPESDLWMKVNSCGYDAKTGKITYGYDIYRMS